MLRAIPITVALLALAPAAAPAQESGWSHPIELPDVEGAAIPWSLSRTGKTLYLVYLAMTDAGGKPPDTVGLLRSPDSGGTWHAVFAADIGAMRGPPAIVHDRGRIYAAQTASRGASSLIVLDAATGAEIGRSEIAAGIDGAGDDVLPALLARGDGLWLACAQQDRQPVVLESDDAGRSWRAHVVADAKAVRRSGMVLLEIGGARHLFFAEERESTTAIRHLVQGNPGGAWVDGTPTPDAARAVPIAATPTARGAFLIYGIDGDAEAERRLLATRSEDGGATWSAGAPVATTTRDRFAALTRVHAGGDMVLLVGTRGATKRAEALVVLSSDGGTTWREHGFSRNLARDNALPAACVAADGRDAFVVWLNAADLMSFGRGEGGGQLLFRRWGELPVWWKSDRRRRR